MTTSPESIRQEPSHQSEAGPQPLDMGPILQRVPPIESVFSPEKEVKKLWSVPKDERRQAVSEFKDKLARQREAWALCRTNIEERIEANPDLPKREMVEVIEKFASHYGFAETHVKVAEKLVDDYIAAHKRVVRVRKRYPNDAALVNRLTGLAFPEDSADDFEISVGSVAVEIRCSGVNTAKLYSESQDCTEPFDCGGFSSWSEDQPPIYFVVINTDEVGDSTIPHEKQHAVYNITRSKLNPKGEIQTDVQREMSRTAAGFLRHLLYEKVLRFEYYVDGCLCEEYESSEDPQQKDFLLEEYMKLKRERAFNRVKDELFAMKKGGRISDNYDYDNVFAPGWSSAHDYLARVRDREEKKSDPLWQEKAKRILVDEYGSVIKSAVDHFDMLLDHGYSREEAIALLSDKSLPSWPKAVKRQLEARGR